MKLYEAIFSNGVAKIIEVETGREAITQPYRPTDVGGVPWESEAEAIEWLHKYHPGFLDQEEIDVNSIGQEENQ